MCMVIIVYWIFGIVVFIMIDRIVVFVYMVYCVFFIDECIMCFKRKEKKFYSKKFRLEVFEIVWIFFGSLRDGILILI